MKVIRALDVPTVVEISDGAGNNIVGLDVVRVEPDGMLWVQAYDPDANGGMGYVNWTADPTRALRFDDFVTAFEFWRQRSTVVPLRTDGKPNRPLTAYSVTFEDEPGI